MLILETEKVDIKESLVSDNSISTEPSPGDLKAVCVDKVQTKIESLCSDDDKQDALKQFADTCTAAGHKVGMYMVDC